MGGLLCVFNFSSEVRVNGLVTLGKIHRDESGSQVTIRTKIITNMRIGSKRLEASLHRVKPVYEKTLDLTSAFAGDKTILVTMENIATAIEKQLSDVMSPSLEDLRIQFHQFGNLSKAVSASQTGITFHLLLRSLHQWCYRNKVELKI